MGSSRLSTFGVYKNNDIESFSTALGSLGSSFMTVRDVLRLVLQIFLLESALPLSACELCAVLIFLLLYVTRFLRTDAYRLKHSDGCCPLYASKYAR